MAELPLNRAPSILLRADLDRLLTALHDRGYRVLGPTVRDAAIMPGEVRTSDDLPVGIGDEQRPGHYRLRQRDDAAVFGYVVGPDSPKRSFHVPRETLVQLRRKGRSFEAVDPPERAATPRLALLGIRACEIQAIAVQDNVLRDGVFADPAYVARREGTFVVAVGCNDPASTCFCTSMGDGPTPERGFDLALTEILPTGEGEPHRFLLRVGSVEGAEVADELPTRAATPVDLASAEGLDARARAAIVRRLDRTNIRERLYAAVESPRWQDVAQRCLTCTNCTMVCPTCFCSRVDESTSLDGKEAERIRSWDSCFSLDYSSMHGGVVRRSVAARYRHWMTHKLASWIDQFGESGCVGCGRCIAWCPAGIDITEEMAAIDDVEVNAAVPSTGAQLGEGQ